MWAQACGVCVGHCVLDGRDIGCLSHGVVCGWRACGGVAVVMATGVAVRGCCWVMRLQDGWTAVMVAAQNGHESTVGLLLDRGADVKATNSVSCPWFRFRLPSSCRR